MLLEISVLIIAAASVIFVVAILIVLRLLTVRLHMLTEKTIAMQQEIQELSGACSKLLETTDTTVKEIGAAAVTVNQVVGAAQDMGQSVSQAASVIRQLSSTLQQRVTRYTEQERNVKQLDDMMQWAELAMSAWQLWQASRQKMKQTERRE